MDRSVNRYLWCSVMSIATVLISVYSMREKRPRTTSGQGLIREAILGNDVNLTKERSEPSVVQGTCLAEGETAWKWGRSGLGGSLREEAGVSFHQGPITEGLVYHLKALGPYPADNEKTIHIFK